MNPFISLQLQMPGEDERMKKINRLQVMFRTTITMKSQKPPVKLIPPPRPTIP